MYEYTRIMNFLAVAILITGMLAAPAIIQSAYAANTLTVRAYSDDGKSLSMYATIKSGNTTVKSGFTPLTYAGTIGKTYTVTVANYKDIVFDHWGNGSTSNPRTVTLTSDITAVAYYKTGSASTASSSSPGNITVQAYSTSGKALSMYTVITSDGKAVKSGFTPLTYAGTIGKTYTVTVANYKDIVFHKWVDSEDDRSRTLKLSGDPFLTAYYSVGP